MRILIAYDGSIHAGIAIEDLQRAGLPSDAEAIVVSVIEDGISAPRSFGMIETDFLSKRMAAADRLAEEACTRLTNYFPQWNIQMETRWGSPAAVLTEKASGWPADLVVVGTHGRSPLGRLVLGSVSMKLVHEAPCSVRVARPASYSGPIRLLIGSDGSSEAEKVVDAVCSRTWPEGTEAKVLAVHEVLIAVNAERFAIGEEPYIEANEAQRHWLKDAADKALDKLQRAGLTASFAIPQGDAKHVLIEAAQDWNASTIFVGARGLGRVDRLLLGSVSSAIVAHAQSTVEVVRDAQAGRRSLAI
jgi:nucleotide-binding universal stress UspA family protein